MDALDARPRRLDILAWAEMQGQAIKDIAGSDIIVVPADVACAASGSFRRWAETWPAALDGCSLLLVPSWENSETWPSSQQVQFAIWLRGLAGRKGMDFATTGLGVELIHAGSAQEQKMVPPAGSFARANYDLHARDDYYFPDWQLPPAPRFVGLNE